MTALQLIRITPRLPDARYFHLHLKCADGTITEDEAAELTMLCAEKERDYAEEYGPRERGAANNCLPSNHGN